MLNPTESDLIKLDDDEEDKPVLAHNENNHDYYVVSDSKINYEVEEIFLRSKPRIRLMCHPRT